MRFGRVLVVAPLLLAGLAACGGGSDEPAASGSTPSPTATSTAEPAESSAAEPTERPKATESLKVEIADPEALSEVEASMQALSAERESMDSNEYLDKANELTARAAAAYGASGMPAFACQMTIGIVSGAQGAEPAAVKVGLGNTLKVVVRNGTGKLNETLTGADLDAQMKKTCPDVRTAALQATGVKTINAL
ncbi:hypothetical protein [Kineosporia babensis]|uniref:Lipoprotein n=1 Tax=Kineosporia babensis TaxID=499548 RepID=A0A9X1SXC2_9ACTN|nr:hypothetical protein [Kineosporia babensis]MCD5316062.1 hypothetical protein [Kineosporia babensis]